MTNFSTWSHSTLVQFATDATAELLRSQSMIGDLREELFELQREHDSQGGMLALNRMRVAELEKLELNESAEPERKQIARAVST